MAILKSIIYLKMPEKADILRRCHTAEGKLRSWGKLVRAGVPEEVLPRNALNEPESFPVDVDGDVNGQILDFTSFSTFRNHHAISFVRAIHRARLLAEFPALGSGHSDDKGNYFETIFDDPRLKFVVMQDVKHQLGEGSIGVVQNRDIINLHYPGISLPPSKTGYMLGLVTASLAEEICAKKGSVVVGEVGVGSGVIMASTLKAFTGKEMSYIGSDIDGACLDIADISMQINGFDPQNYRLKKGSVLEPFHGLGVDLLVSNPPYFPSYWTSRNRHIGPPLALDGGSDGLDFYRKILDEAPRVLAPDGKILLQVSNVNLQQVRALAEAKFRGDARTSIFRQGGRQIYQPTNKGKAVLVEF